MYRIRNGAIEVMLAHPGGPFWKNKDLGAWTIPKGEISPGEEPLSAALREFEEEIGIKLQGDFRPLGSVRQKSGKLVHAWAIEGDCDTSRIKSNIIEIDWPPGSGKKLEVPEVDRAQFFSLDDARVRINPAQAEFLDNLEHLHPSK